MISFQIQFNSAAAATTCCVHVINTCTTESMVERQRSIRAVDGGHGSRARSVGAERNILFGLGRCDVLILQYSTVDRKNDRCVKQ